MLDTLCIGASPSRSAENTSSCPHRISMRQLIITMIRITGGELRGRSLRTPKHSERSPDRTRPTQAKLRQALFNSLQMHIPEARVLDLFAGSGTLGFEALSRGAESVVFVESSREVCRLIQQNAQELGVEDRV